MDWLGFTIVIICLLVSGFLAASETALTGEEARDQQADDDDGEAEPVHAPLE